MGRKQHRELRMKLIDDFGINLDYGWTFFVTVSSLASIHILQTLFSYEYTNE